MIPAFWRPVVALVLSSLACAHSAEVADIRTPPPPATPRLNNAPAYGVRPSAPFLYRIPATGERPMTFAADRLPAGLVLDPATGIITGRITQPDEYVVTLRATNARGSAEKVFKIVCGDAIALTPPMGWNSWNNWAENIDQEKVRRAAEIMISSGLADHGWAYVNIDDTWQGGRGGPLHAIQPNERFPDMKNLCDEIHALGLKAGIYSSPWITTFAGFRGGSGDAPDGAWEHVMPYEANKRLGKYTFTASDARQFADWGFDYLKYDWAPNTVKEARTMALALRATGRDIVLSMSVGAPLDSIGEFIPWIQSWRTTGDIWDTWDTPGRWQQSVSTIGFSQDAWVPYGGPGHWNDPDMLVVGWVGLSQPMHQTRLTPAEQYSHISLWCMLSAPLLIGCDLERLDAFTLNLLTNDEVLAIDQDALGRTAHRVTTYGAIDVYQKDLADGGTALGFFNRGDVPHTIAMKLDRIGLGGARRVRDLWRQQDVGEFTVDLPVTVAPHDVVLYKVTATDGGSMPAVPRA